MWSSATVRLAARCALPLALAGCAPIRPVLYPNAVYQQAGQAGARRDIDECTELAKGHGAGTDAAARTGAGTGEGAAVGAATGAAVGAVLGSAGRGAAAGAAGGGARSLMRGLLHWRDPSPLQRGFVQECLHERGYRVIGWQ